VTAPKRHIHISDCPPSIVANRHIKIHYPSRTSLVASPNRVIYRSPCSNPTASGLKDGRSNCMSIFLLPWPFQAASSQATVMNPFGLYCNSVFQKTGIALSNTPSRLDFFGRPIAIS
jgi:hypothetical protein